VLEVADVSHGEEASDTILSGYGTSRIQSGRTLTVAMTIRNDGVAPNGEKVSPSIDEIAIGDTFTHTITAAGPPHPTLGPGIYAGRITAAASGKDQLTSILTGQILGVVTP
jgi:hypothetical protein